MSICKNRLGSSIAQVICKLASEISSITDNAMSSALISLSKIFTTWRTVLITCTGHGTWTRLLAVLLILPLSKNIGSKVYRLNTFDFNNPDYASFLGIWKLVRRLTNSTRPASSFESERTSSTIRRWWSMQYRMVRDASMTLSICSFAPGGCVESDIGRAVVCPVAIGWTISRISSVQWSTADIGFLILSKLATRTVLLNSPDLVAYHLHLLAILINVWTSSETFFC